MSSSLIVDLNGKPIGVEHTLPPLPPLSKFQAEAFGYMEGVLIKYGLAEVLRCEVCFKAKRIDGVNVRLTSRFLEVKCRCGLRSYIPPKGTTDLIQNRSNSAFVLGQQSEATVEAQNGQTFRVKAIRMDDEDAKIIQLYFRVCRDLQLKPQFVHLRGTDCWDNRVVDESCAKTMVTEHQVAIVCRCRTLYWQDAPVN